MSHPLIPQILQIAEAIAPSVGLEVVDIMFYTHKNPAVLRIDIRNPEGSTSLADCERMSLALEPALDEADIIPHIYELEISSPGTDRHLKSDREFTAFRGFTVTANTSVPHAGKQIWIGQLVSRDADKLKLTQKGKLIEIPWELVTGVELSQ